MESCQQDDSKTVWARTLVCWSGMIQEGQKKKKKKKKKNVHKVLVNCLEDQACLSKLTDRPDKTLTLLTGSSPDQTSWDFQRNDKSTKHCMGVSRILGKVNKYTSKRDYVISQSPTFYHLYNQTYKIIKKEKRSKARNLKTLLYVHHARHIRLQM